MELALVLKFDMDNEQKIESIIQKLDELSNYGLVFKDDISRLIELAIMNNKVELLQELSFQAKYSQSLLKITQTQNKNVDDKYLITIKEEFSIAVEKTKKLIREILFFSTKFYSKIFTEKFLLLTQESFTNFNKLCKDLGYLKLYFNDVKRNG
jgi:hypothetical protein